MFQMFMDCSVSKTWEKKTSFEYLMMTNCFMISVEILCRIEDKQTPENKVVCRSNCWEISMQHACFLTFSSISLSVIHIF